MKERYMARFYTRTQLEHSITGGGLHDSIQMKIEKGFNKELSGGVALVVQPYSFFSGLSTGTTHGTPNAYDTHVPLVLFGEGVRRGKYSYPVSPSIISATLSDLLGISVPSNSSGVAWHGIIR
jgi:hypothetical protein